MANKRAFSKTESMAKGVTPSPRMRIQTGMKTPGPGRFTFPVNGSATPKKLLLTGPDRDRMTS